MPLPREVITLEGRDLVVNHVEDPANAPTPGQWLESEDGETARGDAARLEFYKDINRSTPELTIPLARNRNRTHSGQKRRKRRSKDGRRKELLGPVARMRKAPSLRESGAGTLSLSLR